MEQAYAWHTLAVIGTSEGPDLSGTIDFVVGPGIVRTEDWRYFLITDARVERPSVRNWIETGELVDRESAGSFAILKGEWRARREHVVVSVSAGLVEALAEASLVIPSAEQEETRNGWRLLYVALADVADVRVRVARAFLDRVRRSLTASRAGDPVADEVWRWLAYAGTIARHGSFEHAEAMVLSVLRHERGGAEASEIERAKKLCLRTLRMDAATLEARLEAKRKELDA